MRYGRRELVPQNSSTVAALPVIDSRLMVKELAQALRDPMLLAQALHEPVVESRYLPVPVVMAPSPVAEVSGDLPQILQSSLGEPDLPKLSTWRTRPPARDWHWLTGRLSSAPLGIATGLGAVALMVLASFGGFEELAGGDLRARPPLQALAAIDPTTRLMPALASGPLDASQQLIARGDIDGARAVLNRAATAGDVAATLALAETFDPNMLAAWGARGQSADVVTAKVLYGKALAAGEERARQRLNALIIGR